MVSIFNCITILFSNHINFLILFSLVSQSNRFVCPLRRYPLQPESIYALMEWWRKPLRVR